MKNQKGFVTVLCLTITPLLFGLLFTFSILRSYLQISFSVKQVCRYDSLNLQQANILYLEKLFSLNPTAKALRAAKIGAEIALAAAIAAENPPGIAAAEQELESIFTRQLDLDLQQNMIIQTANHAMDIGSIMLRQKIKMEIEHYQQRLRFFVSISLSEVDQSVPQLAVRPDIAGDTAPVYVEDIDFTNKQSLQTFWSVHFSAKDKWLENWVKVEKTFSLECQTSLKKKGLEWKKVLVSYAKIQRDKSF
jgi:hypothetical protein